VSTTTFALVESGMRAKANSCLTPDFPTMEAGAWALAPFLLRSLAMASKPETDSSSTADETNEEMSEECKVSVPSTMRPSWTDNTRMRYRNLKLFRRQVDVR